MKSCSVRVEDCDQLSYRLVELVRRNLASTITHDPGVGGKKPVWPNMATLVQTAVDKVGAFEPDRVSVFPCLTGDLAKDLVVSL